MRRQPAMRPWLAILATRGSESRRRARTRGTRSCCGCSALAIPFFFLFFVLLSKKINKCESSMSGLPEEVLVSVARACGPGAARLVCSRWRRWSFAAHPVVARRRAYVEALRLLVSPATFSYLCIHPHADSLAVGDAPGAPEPRRPSTPMVVPVPLKLQYPRSAAAARSACRKGWMRRGALPPLGNHVAPPTFCGGSLLIGGKVKKPKSQKAKKPKSQKAKKPKSQKAKK